MTISKNFSFEAAHMLSNYDGPCSNLHGHSYAGTVTIDAPIDQHTHMVLDYNLIKEVINEFDHAVIFSGSNIRSDAEEALCKWAQNYGMKTVILDSDVKCTAEDMCMYLAAQLKSKAGDKACVTVTLCETKSAAAIYTAI